MKYFIPHLLKVSIFFEKFFSSILSSVSLTEKVLLVLFFSRLLRNVACITDSNAANQSNENKRKIGHQLQHSVSWRHESCDTIDTHFGAIASSIILHLLHNRFPSLCVRFRKFGRVDLANENKYPLISVKNVNTNGTEDEIGQS